MKDERVYLVHIQECLDRINQYVKAGRGSFIQDLKTQDAVLRNLQTLAESSRKISLLLTAKHPEVDWRGLAGFRNVMVHDYLGLDLEQIWNIIQHDLPLLRRAIQQLLSL